MSSRSHNSHISSNSKDSVLSFSHSIAPKSRTGSNHQQDAATQSPTDRNTNVVPFEMEIDMMNDGADASTIASASVAGGGMTRANLEAALQASGGSTRSVRTANTTRSGGDGSVRSVGTKGTVEATRVVKADDNGGFVVPTYTLVSSEQPSNGGKKMGAAPMILPYPTPKDMVMPPKKAWQSKWFWLVLVLIALLLLGIGIGIGNGMAFGNNSSSKETTTTTVAGFEDVADGTIDVSAFTSGTSNTTTNDDVPSESPTDSPTLSPFVATTAPTTTPPPTTPAPTTAKPTNAQVPGCKGVPHSEGINERATAKDAGMFGGSSYCRDLSFVCEVTNWVKFSTYEGTTSAWFSAIAYEDSFCLADIEHRIKLTVPEGVDYNLHVYRSTASQPYDSSTLSGDGMSEEVIISGDDEAMMNNSFLYYVHVEYKSGTSCEPWKLEIFGHQCL